LKNKRKKDEEKKRQRDPQTSNSSFLAPSNGKDRDIGIQAPIPIGLGAKNSEIPKGTTSNMSSESDPSLTEVQSRRQLQSLTVQRPAMTSRRLPARFSVMVKPGDV